jgi:exodeoxyribonuclease III
VIVATWNVNGLRARWPRLCEWLKERAPDVACLQELKMESAQFPDLELRSMGYQAVVLGQLAWNGVAVISRLPLQPGIDGIAFAPDLGSRAVSAFVELPSLGRVEVMSVYVPNGKSVSHEDFPKKLAWLNALADHLQARDKATPLVMGGDFNLCPRDLDSCNPQGFAGSIFHTAEERAAYARIEQAGYKDLFVAKHPDEQVFSWWDYRSGAFHKKQGLRIDMLFGNAAVEAATVSVRVDREYRKKSKEGSTPSDHAPVLLELSAGSAP